MVEGICTCPLLRPLDRQTCRFVATSVFRDHRSRNRFWLNTRRLAPNRPLPARRSRRGSRGWPGVRVVGCQQVTGLAHVVWLHLCHGTVFPHDHGRPRLSGPLDHLPGGLLEGGVGELRQRVVNCFRHGLASRVVRIGETAAAVSRSVSGLLPRRSAWAATGTHRRATSHRESVGRDQSGFASPLRIVVESRSLERDAHLV
jgi:hypothetical protein